MFAPFFLSHSVLDALSEGNSLRKFRQENCPMLLVSVCEVVFGSVVFFVGFVTCVGVFVFCVCDVLRATLIVPVEINAVIKIVTRIRLNRVP
jgi:hypothetical protein